MSIIDDFKAFALRGNMVDLAIGVVIGTAFGKVVNSLVADIIMPSLSLLIGGIDFSAWTIPLAIPGLSNKAELNIGSFINAALDFFIIAWAIFIVMKGMNRFYKKEEKKEPKTKQCPECAMDIPVIAKKCGFCTSEI